MRQCWPKYFSQNESASRWYSWWCTSPSWRRKESPAYLLDTPLGTHPHYHPCFLSQWVYSTFRVCCRGVLQFVAIKTLEMSGSAKSKLVISNVATYSCVVIYRCHVATVEWLSSAVENTAGKTQSCNPVLFMYCESEPIFFEILSLGRCPISFPEPTLPLSSGTGKRLSVFSVPLDKSLRVFLLRWTRITWALGRDCTTPCWTRVNMNTSKIYEGKSGEARSRKPSQPG